MRVRAAIGTCFAAVALAMLGPGTAAALEVPPGYRVDAPMEGVSRPAALAFAANGDVFVAERNGRVRVFHGVDDPQPTLALDIAAEVHSVHDRGLVTIALDPEYPAEPYLYLSYPYDAPLGQVAPVHEQGPDGDDNCVLLAGGAEDCLISGRVSRFELDPATGIAVGGAASPNEEVLVSGWCQQYSVHSMGDLAFDAAGALLASGGEGANFAALDYGQFGNPCGDPPNAGGSLRSQDLEDRALLGDPTGYNGSVIRIDPETGDPWPTNPLIGSADVDARRIVGIGLRNPFRIEVRPGTSELWVAEVGSTRFEEIDLIPDPANQPGGPRNFGWPCLEGPGPESGFQSLAFSVPLGLCLSLYESPGANLTSPYFTYPRTGALFAGDECDPANGAAIAGLSFYERADAPPPGALPEDLDGALLLADAVRGCVWAMRPGIDGRPDPATLESLIVPAPEDEGALIPVNLTLGPDGALYMPDFWNDRISRLRYFAGNQPPVARIDTVPAPYGSMEAGEFTLELDGSGSTDEEDEGGDLTYEWDLNGDGVFEQTGVTLEPTYTEPVNVIAQLRVTDTEGATDVARTKLYPGDLPPENLTMASPAPGTEWTVGEEVELEGSATDPDGDADSGEPPRLDWDVLIRHCPDQCHSHPLAHISDAGTASVIAPDHEYPTHLLVTLTASDSRGLSETISREVHPRTAEVTLRSEPPGVALTIDTTTQEAPFAKTLLAGGEATVTAPEKVVLGGQEYTFASWSDGGPRTHLIGPTEAVTLTASYAAPALAPIAAPTGPILSPRPQRVRLRLASRPGGLPLRLGGEWRRSAFARWVRKGQRVRIEAPLRLRRHDRLLTFSHWAHGGHRVQWVKPNRARTLVAVFEGRSSLNTH